MAFRKIVKESFVCVASPKFISKYQINRYQDCDINYCIKFIRTDSSLLDLEVETNWYFGVFSDISSQREAALMGYGWAIIPYYAVAREIENKELVIIPGRKIEEESYGVWWSRSNSKPEIMEIVDHAKVWPKSLES